jgi:hypothetical protein
MRAAYLLLLGLISISPASLFVDGPIVHALIVAYAAVTVGLVGVLIRPGEARHLATVIRPVAIISVVFALWLLVQMMPLPTKSWAHPIWSDAETALGTPIAGRITIDPGATVVAICRYFSAIAILFVATAVTIDRPRAERVLFWLVGATTICAVLQILHGLVAFPFLDVATDAVFTTSAAALCALGAVIAAATMVLAMERRYETPRTKIGWTNLSVMSLALVAFGICGLSLVIFAPALVGIAAAAGLATFIILMIVRRLGFGVWVGDTIAAVAMGVAIALTLIIAESHAGSGDAVLRYASHSQSSLSSIVQRIIADTGWSGTGAGTFELLLPIYRESSAITVPMPVPSTAAKITIELGRPAFWAILTMTTVALFLLLQGTLQRGRDSFYPAAGAGCLVILILEAFCDASFFSTTVLVCAMVALGLALSQSISRAIDC